MEMNQSRLFQFTSGDWFNLGEGAGWWKLTDEVFTPSRKRLKFELLVYRLMRDREKIPFPRRSKVNGSPVKIQGETYSERWLVHYYHLRHFQPCRQVASFTAGRMTGEYHEGNGVSAELDYERLFKAREILNRLKSTVLSPSTKSKGQ
jgi:hypothetical protein